LNRVFADKGASLTATSIKGNVGHTAGAAGVMGIMAGLHVFDKGVLGPTASATDLDDEMRYEAPIGGKPAPVETDAVQVNGFGFGGQDASIVVTRSQG